MTNYDMDEIIRQRDKEKRESEKGIAEWIEEQAEFYPDMVRLEPREDFDLCVIGLIERMNLNVLCYDVQAILLMLQDRASSWDTPSRGMSELEAREHFEYNILGSWCGDHSPVFLNRHFISMKGQYE